MIMSNPSLPPGFRFHPTDEELILHYLRSRTASAPCPAAIIADVDIYKFDPWDLPSKAVYGDREWYFFSPRDRKYPNGIRPNRAAGSGYWKATGTDKPIHDGANENIGVKKALVFYKGRPPRGTKTNWIMHEYRLAADPRADAGRSSSYKPTSRFQNVSMRLDDWVLCRIYKKSSHEAPMAAPPPLADHEEDVLYGFDVNRLNAPPLPPSGAVYMPWMPEPLDEYTLAQLFDSDCTAVPAETEHHLPLLGYHFVDELLANNSVPQLADTDYSSSSASSTAAVGDGSGKRKLSSQEDGSDHGSLVGHHEAKRPNTSCFDAAFSAALTQLPAGLRDQTALFDRF